MDLIVSGLAGALFGALVMFVVRQWSDDSEFWRNMDSYPRTTRATEWIVPPGPDDEPNEPIQKTPDRAVYAVAGKGVRTPWKFRRKQLESEARTKRKQREEYRDA